MDGIANEIATEFQPAVVDKVERLLDLLEEMGRHPALKGKLCMHGGTAINLFMLGIPRLSVDIDISYIGAEGREAMMEERPSIESAIMQIGNAQGYSVSPTKGDHAGRTFKLLYRGGWGPDNVKIDVIYLNRVPLLPVQPKSCPMRSGISVVMFDDLELIGGKVKAFYDRVKIRDLYDIANIYAFLSEREESSFAHKVILYHASISACFPNSFEKRAKTRFADRQRDLEQQLYPMLKGTDDAPTLEQLITRAELFIEDYVLPQDDTEQEFLDRFAAGSFKPELLFGVGETAEKAARSPEAAWKLLNLKKMLGR